MSERLRCSTGLERRGTADNRQGKLFNPASPTLSNGSFDFGHRGCRPLVLVSPSPLAPPQALDTTTQSEGEIPAGPPNLRPSAQVQRREVTRLFPIRLLHLQGAGSWLAAQMQKPQLLFLALLARPLRYTYPRPSPALT
jgi:hypothetical protein